VVYVVYLLLACIYLSLSCSIFFRVPGVRGFQGFGVAN